MTLQQLLTRTFIGICSLLITACASQKKYTPKEFDLPEEFRLPDSINENLENTLIPRNQFFKDSVLLELIDHALIHNFESQLTEKEILINEAYLKEAKSAFYPHVNLNLFSIEKRWYSEYTRNSPSTKWYDSKNRDPSKNLFVERSEYSSSLALDWEVDIWGKIRKQKEAALAFYQQSEVARRALQTQLIATLAEDYYNLVSLDEQLKVAEENHQYRDSTLTMIELLYESGEVSALAVQQSQSQVLEASSLISKLTELRVIQENNLRLLAGKLPGDIQRSFELHVDDSTYQEVKELPLYLVQNRPDIVLSQYDLSIANARAGITQAQKMPNLNISLNGGLNSFLPKNWFNIPGALFGEVMGGLTAPIFQGRKLKTEHEVALLMRDKAEINFQRKVYEAVVDIENTLTSLKMLEDQLEIANVQQLVSQQALNNSRMLFSSGFADYLEVITAQSEALHSELELVRTKADLLTMRIQLYRALGGGWK